MKVKIYVEGGGESSALKTSCRKGFNKLIEKAGLKGYMPRIISCGSRRRAYEDFCHALKVAEAGVFIMLLVDSEDPVAPTHGPWTHLLDRQYDQWACPDDADDDNVHLMVQCMETWFLADKAALAQYYGRNFAKGCLPPNPHIEDIPKLEVLKGLENATKQTQKGQYKKGNHSFNLLERVDPAKLRQASPSAERFFKTLLNKPDK
ncbi:MAG: DUF4276 family protein [Deltaproteobacteria bacterium]|nr:DUF4276 family protein [Deltaproteobacteria bacterium]